MSGCSNYAENLWKKGKCSNCFRPKDQHNIATKDEVRHNGEKSWSKTSIDASKKLTPQSNGHSTDRRQESTKVGDDGREFMLRNKSNSGKIFGATDIVSTKTAFPTNQTSRQNGSSDKESASFKKEIEELESTDKPRPIPRHRQRRSSKNSSFEEDLLKSPCSDESSSAVSVTSFTVNGTTKSNITTTDICTVNKTGNSTNSHSKQINSGGKISTREKSLNTMEGESKAENTKPCTTTGVAKHSDGEYMPMNNNVCNDEITSERKVEPIKMTSPIPCKKDDSSEAIINKTDSLDKANKQGDERCKNIHIDSTSSIRLPNEACPLNAGKDTLISEPFYENRSRVSSDRSSSTSSEKSLSKKITSPSDRPESIAFKVQVDIDEIRSSSIFEDIIVESSGSSCNSSNSGSSYETSADNTSETQPTMSTTVDSPTNMNQVNSTLRRSNPDVTKLVEGPSYTNSSVKPQTKPYKVVDISTCMLVHENEGDNADIPPLPPKEKELNRQKETSGPDHYYYEPPDDIVPDYKKLTPLNTEPPPPPVIVKKEGECSTVPASLKSMPIPRPRSQLPSYSSSTLPRPVPRTAKQGLDVKQQINRPVSQVVTRPTNKDAPRPPSTSKIPSRKPMTEVSPPISPTQSPKSSNGSIDSKDHSIKPKRTAPPPPLLAVPKSGGQPSGRSPTTPTDPRKDSPQTTPTPSPSPSRMEQSAHSKSSTLQSAKQQGRSTIKRALSSWKRLSGRRKNKKRLDISSPVMMSEESDSTGDDLAVCTSIKERKRGSTILEQPSPEANPSDTEEPFPLPSGKPGRPYQNFPFSKTNLEKPVKPDRPAKAVKPDLQVKPEVNQNVNNQPLESPAYLEPCTGGLTLKTEAALANLNDAKILAETLTRVEQEKLGPLPQVPLSRHVHFRFNETAGSRPVTAVAPTVVSPHSQPKYTSRPASTHSQDGRLRSKSLTVKTRVESGSRARSGSTQESMMKKRYDKILELHRQTLQDMIDSSKEQLLPGDTIDISNTRWIDYEVCGEPLTTPCPGAVLLPVVVPRVDDGLVLLAKVKIPKSVTEDMSQRTAFMQDMAITVSLPFHANVSRTITHFTDHLPADLFGLQSSTNFETLVTITDQVPVETVQEFLERTVQEHVELADEFERKVCILMLQVLSALDHLYQEGVVHRGLVSNNLLLLDYGHLVVSNFSHVLQKSGGSTTSSQFHYTKDSIGNIGGDPHRIPPEIHKAYNEGESIDFAKCDSFSVGCLIYELLHQPNPFAADPSLLSRDYSIRDLPVLLETSRFTSGLATLASGLLQREPSLRMLPRDALKLLRAFMFGPEELDDSSLELSASDWLETERAHAVIDIARTQAHGAMIDGEEMLENYLKYQYLVNLTEHDILEGYTALLPAVSQA